MKQLVITAVGPDRPGIVGRLTAPLLEASANLADSRMVNLRGQFAVIVLAEVPERSVDQVQMSLLSVAEELGLTLTFREHTRQEDKGPTTVGVPFRMRAYAMDQPGIVHRITDLLYRMGINVEELETRAQPRPETGTPLFSMDLRMTVPSSVAIKRLRSDLEALCDALNCDVDLQQTAFSS